VLLKYVISFVQQIPIPFLVMVGVVALILLASRHFQVQVQRDAPVAATELDASQTSVSGRLEARIQSSDGTSGESYAPGAEGSKSQGGGPHVLRQVRKKYSTRR